MIREGIGVFIGFHLLALIGLGPAMRLVRNQEHRLLCAIGSAPAIGLMIIVLLGYPLVRYLAPVQTWVWPITLILVAGSLALAVREWRQYRADATVARTGWRALLIHVGIIEACCLVLASPLLFRGIQYAVFRSNPSDAFTYITLAESFAVVDWDVLWVGGPLNALNLEAAARLAAVSPTALFNARILSDLHFVPGSTLAYSWLAQLAGVPTYRYYYAFNMVALAAAVPLALSLTRLLNLQRVLVFGAALAMVFSFWTWFILENDSTGQISTIPILLFAVLAWSWLEQASLSEKLPLAVALSLAGAAIVSAYYPVLLVLIGSWILFYGWQLVHRQRIASALLLPLAVVAGIPTSLALTGQLDYFIGTFQISQQVALQQAAFYGFGMELLKGEGFSAMWGFSDSILTGSFSSVMPVWLWRRLANEVGTVMTLATLGASGFILRKTAPVAEQIILSVVVSGCGLAGVYFVQHNDRAAAKAFTYIFPYLILLAGLISNYLHLLFQPILRLVAEVFVLGYFVAQVSFGAVMPYLNGLGGALPAGAVNKPEQYDLDPILTYLDLHSPQRLLVAIPRVEGWTFPFYTMFAFSRYQAYYQSGLIVDNSMNSRNLWFEQLQSVPDYAVILKADDYLGAEDLGVLVAETKDLALYKITSDDVGVFVEKELAYQQQELAKSLP